VKCIATAVMSDDFSRRQPVAEPTPMRRIPIYAADARGQLRAEKASIGGLIRDPADGRETQVDRAGCGARSTMLGLAGEKS
jgi:hypothetical protein